MKKIPLNLLMYDGPISRAYLGLFFENGLTFNKIYLLVYKKDLINKKEILKFFPDFIKQKVAKNIQRYQLNYWVIKLKKTYPEIFRNIKTKMLESTKLNNEIYDHLINLKHLSFYSKNIEEIFFNNISDLNNLFKKEKKQNFLFTSGGILSAECFNNNTNKIIHIHPGYLPDVKGADGLLWSMKHKNKAGVSAFYMNEKVDNGKIIYRENFILPKFDKKLLSLHNNDIYRIIYAYIDPLVRAFCLKKLIRISNGKMKFKDLVDQKKLSGKTFTFMDNKQKKEIYKKLC